MSPRKYVRKNKPVPPVIEPIVEVKQKMNYILVLSLIVTLVTIVFEILALQPTYKSTDINWLCKPGFHYSEKAGDCLVDGEYK